MPILPKNIYAADDATYILGIIIVAVIILGLVAYFVIDRLRDKKYIAEIEAKREEQKRIDSEKEILRAEYRKAKKIGSDFLLEADKEAAKEKQGKTPDISKIITKPASIQDVSLIDDETCDLLTLTVKDNKVYNQKIRRITITTTHLNEFADGDIVNPVSLAEKGIIPNYSHYFLVVEAKAPVKKSVEVEAHEYDESAKMILIAGGKVTKVI